MAMQKLSFQWNIKKFDMCDLAVNEFFDSPQFSITEHTTFKSNWKFRMYPAGFKVQTENSTDISLLLLRLDSGPIFHTKHSISLLNRNGCRIETGSYSELCETLKFSDSGKEIEKAAKTNIVKLKMPKYPDNEGILSVLCEIEIYEKSEIISEVTEYHVQMRGISWVVPNMHKPVKLNLSVRDQSFYLPYGKRMVLFESSKVGSRLHLKITKPSKIEEVPVTIINNTDLNPIKRTYNITSKYSVKTVWFHEDPIFEPFFEICARCTVESIPAVSTIDLTPCLRKMQSDYRNMFSQPEAGDISILVDGKTLRVHKNVLSARCPVFAAMFSQEWLEKATQTIPIKDFDYKTILAMIEFIYFGGCDVDSDEEAADPIDLMKAAHMYQLDHLKNSCEERLCQNLENSNISSYTELADAYDLLNLRSEIFAIKSNDQED